jgi:hypothetical protein
LALRHGLFSSPPDQVVLELVFYHALLSYPQRPIYNSLYYKDL